MAGISSRTILVCSFPAIITLLTFLWVRKKKKNSSLNSITINSAIKSELEKKLNYEQFSDEQISEPFLNPENESRVEMSDEIKTLILSETIKDNIEINLIENKLIVDDLKSLKLDSTRNEENELTRINEEEELKRIKEVENQVEEDLKMTNEIELIDINRVEIKFKDETNVNEKIDEDFVVSNRELLLIQEKLEEQREEEEEGKGEDVFAHPELLDVIESPPASIYSDGHSEDSSDSGKGGSDIQGGSNGCNYDFSSCSPLSSTGGGVGGEEEDPLHLQVYEFELSQELCGRLIGRLGKHVNFIKSRTNANVYIKRHPFNPPMKICSIEGTHAEIKNALELIRKRFPLNQFSNVTLVQVNLPLTCGIMVPETLQLNLPVGVTCDVILSSMVSAGHFFIQQPTHPTYPSLSRLDLCMSSCYSQIDTPLMPQPVEVGVICSAPTMGGWYRAQVVNINQTSDECDIKFVDYGGYSSIPLASLRQIRSDFMTLPFQASECYLANVRPIEEIASKEGMPSSSSSASETVIPPHQMAASSACNWSIESCATFEELAQGQILQALVVGHAEDGVPFVHLYRVQGVSTVFINRELVNRGIAHWIEQTFPV